MGFVGMLKITLALALLVGIWIPGLGSWAAIGLGVLMLGAFAMHLKIGDPFRKALPALTLLVLCGAIALL